MRKNRQSDTQKKIEKFLQSNPKIVKNLLKDTKSNREIKDISLNHFKETSPKSVKHIKEPVFMKDQKNPKGLSEIMIEVR
jgi:hypothetical protein